MYYADEVRDFAAVEKEGGEVRDKEIALAEMLIDELTVEAFDPLAYKDEYRERLMDRIRAKAEGEVIVSRPADEEKAAEVVDIMEALRRSLEGNAAGKRAPAKRAPAKNAQRGKTAAPAPKKRRAS
jgi:DNA end-binding protein Ku